MERASIEGFKWSLAGDKKAGHSGVSVVNHIIAEEGEGFSVLEDSFLDVGSLEADIIEDFDDEEALGKDGSYPSGHTAIGWAWALILMEVYPEQADVIMERGLQFGISRNVCNVHWHSDVVAGRMMGAAAVAKLHANADFIIDLKVAKEEIKALKN